MPKLYQLLNSMQKMKLNRLQRVMREGSPKYHYDLGAIAAAAYVEFDIERYFPRAHKYAPLDTMLVINNDAVNIGVTVNGSGGDYFIIPAGTIRTVTRDECPAIWQIRITNLDAAAAVTVNMIDLEFSRSPEDVNSIARMEL